MGKTMKAIYVLLFILFGFPLLLVSCTQMLGYGVGFGLIFAGDYALEAAEEYVENINKGEWQSGGDVRIYSEDWGAKSRFNALKKFDQLTDARHVKFEINVPLNQMASKDRKADLQDRSMAKLIANDWATRYGVRECERLKTAFAKKCEVASRSASVRKGGYANIKITLNFTQKQEFGEVLKAAKLAFQEVGVTLGKKRGNRKKFTWRSAESYRRGLYRKVAQECARIRKRMRNCAIGNLSISASGAGKSGSFLLYDKAILSFIDKRKN